MKRKLTLLVIALIIHSNFLYSQEYPTKAEIYNFEIGDVFHIYEYGSAANAGFAATTNLEILDKFYSTGGDTLFYSQLNKRYENGYGYPNPVYTEEIETIFYTDLDEIYEGDSVFEDADFFNGRLSTTYKSIYTDEYFEDTYTIGCGRVYHNYRCLDPENLVDYEVSLVYYKKGDEEWGNAQIVGIDKTINNNNLKLRTFPNPATTYITFELPYLSTDNILHIMDLSGKYIAEIPLATGQKHISWNCGHLSNGVYFYQTEINGEVYRGKIVVN